MQIVTGKKYINCNRRGYDAEMACRKVCFL